MSGYAVRPRSVRASAALRLLVTTAVAGMLGVGCNTETHVDRDVQKAARDVASEIEPLSRAAEEWGTISMSSPLLVKPGPDQRFKLNLTADDYFKFARNDVNAAVATSLQEALDVQIAAKLTANIDELLANVASLDRYSAERNEFDRAQRQQHRQAAFGELADSLRATVPLLGVTPGASQNDVLSALINALDLQAGQPTSAPAYPTFPTLVTTSQPTVDSDLLPTTRPAKAMLSSPTFTAPGGLLTTRPASTPLNDAILEAHSAHSIATILSLLTPEDAARFADKRVLFGVAIITVNPGWRTYRNYAAELTIDVGYRAPNEGVKYPGAHTSRSRAQRLLDDLGTMENKQILELLTHAADEITDLKTRNKTLADAKNKLDQGSVSEAVAIIVNKVDLLKSGRAKTLSDDIAKLKSVYTAAREQVQPTLKGGGSRAGEASEGLAPLVAAVSPLTQGQNLDLSSSIREQVALALKISAALQGMGAGAQAELFSDYVRRLEQDAQSRTVLNTVVARSHSGGTFGYRIAPSFRALVAPGAKDVRSGLILEPQTFPVLIVFGIDKADQEKLTENPRIYLTQTLQWMPLGDAHKDDAWLGFGFYLRPRPRISETERMEWAIHASEAHAILNQTSQNLNKKLGDPNYAAEQSLLSFARARTVALQAQACSSTSWQAIPDGIWSDPEPPKTPVVSDLQPRELSYAGLTGVKTLLVGENLDRCDPNSVRVVLLPKRDGVQPAPSAKVDEFTPLSGGHGATVSFSVNNAPDPEPFLMYLELRPKDATKIATISPPIMVRAKTREENAKLEFNVTDKDGHSSSISYDPRVNLEVLKAYLAAIHPASTSDKEASVNVNVQAAEKRSE